MKLETNETKSGTPADDYEIAKRWYTEQRGRVLGNTVSWEDLPNDEQWLIIFAVRNLLAIMRDFWKSEPTPHEQRSSDAGKRDPAGAQAVPDCEDR